MDLYANVSQQLARTLTRSYSSSFSASSLLFPKHVRNHIYNIYGLVRIADEIVDTYQGDNKRELLDRLESETYASIESGYSTNPIVQAFVITAQKHLIDEELIAPFFASMRSDITLKPTLSQTQYDEYIYGSAEVVGLMCLKVFVAGDKADYDKLANGAKHLGAAYQKTNFLRDFASDYTELGRVYFPGVTFAKFSETDKKAIVTDIRADFDVAKLAIPQLPESARRAVRASYYVYRELLDELALTPADTIKSSRVRISNWRKSNVILTSLANKDKS